MKNYSCENSDSCSLVSVTGISANSSYTESCSSSLRSSSVSSIESDSSNVSKSHTSESSGSCCSYSSESTYSDNSTNKTTDLESSCNSKSVSDSSCVQSKSNSVNSDNCEEQCGKKCEKLVKKYNCSKEELLAISDIIIVLNFIKNKITAVQPNIDLRGVDKYAVQDNINWLECFVDTLFCVLRKNEAYKVIKVRDCKLKNDSEIITDNRTYLIKIKYCSKAGEVNRNIPLVFKWSQLTNNDAKSYKAILNYVVKEIDDYIKGYQAASTIPFLC